MFCYQYKSSTGASPTADNAATYPGTVSWASISTCSSLASADEENKIQSHVSLYKVFFPFFFQPFFSGVFSGILVGLPSFPSQNPLSLRMKETSSTSHKATQWAIRYLSLKHNKFYQFSVDEKNIHHKKPSHHIHH